MITRVKNKRSSSYSNNIMLSSRTESIGESSKEHDNNNINTEQGVLERMKRIRSAPSKIVGTDELLAQQSTTTATAAQCRQRYFIEDEIKRFEVFRTVIQHEDDLLNQRVSWIILAQSFLMAAVFTSEKGDFGQESNGLKYITAGLGITTILITMPSIVAAGQNIELQQRVYFQGISSEERCYELHGHGRDQTMTQDELDNRWKYGHVFPNMAYRGRWALPILNVVIMLAVAQICGWILFLLAIVYGW
mmetsp:Transcript_7327/g.10695  ORF Transcript_7327/g.10695 Transcript_7327/m.10695 type:complete len:248 (+) Transcript_7327:100-843(+)|eukprot:CAMPEP_0201694106 /NCGR_PEP_ID=MMETSP0578-20130828/6483_1 /ASSEMBLY_ACC=CAM_ASM_000663 /TAXON_ID=267565 /ORGANISM="Skeletonema grethea, Strain CCMP 1804" /LENGTH=247 /DNA_ID=CAMNT_0048179735 /DNA_START=30 /DNA_END=770 /DNA_ORIENTATION=+